MVTDLISEMIAYYARRARWHDEYMSYVSLEETEKLMAPMIRIFESLMCDRTVLELACGTGNWTQVLAGIASDVVATDVNKAALQLARKKDYGKGSVTFMELDAYALKGLTKRVDVVFAADWFSHIPRQERLPFIEQLHRAVGKGVSVVFVDMLPYEDPDGGEVWFDSAGNRLHRRALPDGTEFTVVKNFPTEAELQALLEGMAEEVRYLGESSLKRWLLTYCIR